MSLVPNRILGEKYRLIRPLDTGGIGSVWLAEHLSLAAPVAVKLISSPALTATRLERFLREARAAAAVRGPNVVQMLDYGVDDGTPFIVMELLVGESLAARLHRTGRLAAGETEAIIRQVSRAVARAHDGGIVHRDLKPGNIFIARNEDEEIIKLLDFGISKAAAEDMNLAKPSRTASFLGTPCYMSPEQLEGSQLCDHRTDIWALGVITFECLLGRLPFAGKGIGGMVLCVCSGPIPVPSEHGRVPAGFDAWFARACARNLDERFENARDAAKELRALVERGHDAERAALAEQPTPPGAPPAESTRATPNGRSPDALPTTTAPPSSATLDRNRERQRSGSPWLLAPFVLILAIALVVRGVRRSASAEPAAETMQPAAATAAAAMSAEAAAAAAAAALPAPELLPATPEAAGLAAFGEGPGLLLSVDGNVLGALPRDVHDLTPGQHAVTISGGPRYHPYETNVTLAPGQVARLGPVKLEVARGLATLVAGEGAERAKLTLKLGKRELVLPPLPVQLEIETDKPHTLLARRKGYESYEEPLSFEPGQAEKTFQVSLARLHRKATSTAKRKSPRRVSSGPPKPIAAAPPTFSFRSTPESAVVLDGVPLGNTPLLDVPVSAGSHRVIFIRGAQRKAMLVVGTSGKNRVVATRFRPEPEATRAPPPEP